MQSSPNTIIREKIGPEMVSNGAAGLVDRLAQPGTTAEQEGLALAKDIAQGGPIALRMAKAAINNGLAVDTNTGLQLEESYYAQVNSCCRDAIIPLCSNFVGADYPFLSRFCVQCSSRDSLHLCWEASSGLVEVLLSAHHTSPTSS